MFGEPNVFVASQFIVELGRDQLVEWSALRVEVHVTLSFLDAVQFPQGFVLFNPIP